MKRVTNTQEFIQKAKTIHGDKYDYSKVEYINAHAKIIIICPIHGEFEQTPSNHLTGFECYKCATNKRANKRKSNIEDFVQKAKRVHGEKYDYSKAIYDNVKSKLIIICPKHGEFLQKANSHLNGNGCQKCKTQKMIERCRDTTETFIQKARKIHDNKYNYSLVNYINQRVNITIICLEHGKFKQAPSNHLSGKGCAKCAGRDLSTEDFIKEARKIHGEKYNYSKAIYTKGKNKTTIICSEHGEFSQSPVMHLNGQGCAKCQGLGFTYLSFEDWKKIIQPLELKTEKEYINWWNKNKKYCEEKGIPKTPDQYYGKHK